MRYLITLAVLFLASQSRAASVVYDHPALKVKLTIHTMAGAKRPDAVSYEGPKGFYLIKNGDLSSLSRYDGWTQWRYQEYALTEKGFSTNEVSYMTPVVSPYGDAAAVKMIEVALSALQGKGKQEAPDEFAVRVADLRRKSAHARGTYASLSTITNSYGGMVKDPAVVAAQDATIASGERIVAESAALRVTGEADAARAAATASNPNPKAEFYWQQSLKLDAAESAIGSAQYALDQQPIPAY